MKELDKIFKSIAETTIHIGEIRAYGGEAIPPRWKICDGTIISRTVYSQLFSVIGTICGGGDGSSTFALPDLCGRTIMGIGESTATGHSLHTLGQMGGEEKHALTGAELPSHNHNSGQGWTRINSSGYGGQPLSWPYFSGDPWSGNVTGGAGSNTPHNTMQPYATCKYIIYTGV